jgi:L-aminopeptidase/D-esterase-like protein
MSFAAKKRPRARDLGIPFDGDPGPFNAITDVPGVEVGYVTLIEGEGRHTPGNGPIRTGVTAILPHGREGIGLADPAGWYSLNGNGEMTGTTWIEESGSCATPILITNTHAVGPVHAGSNKWTLDNRPDLIEEWLLPVVAETWDGYLNDINGMHVTAEHAIQAINNASGGPVAEGGIGGGTGMTCYAFKGGSGTASRTVTTIGERYTVGVFVQANFGRREELMIAGVPVGKSLLDDNPQENSDWDKPAGAGSVIVIIMTDAPLLPNQCKALARRGALGLARTGTTSSHFSGDIMLALSTAVENAGALTSQHPSSEHSRARTVQSLQFIPWGAMDPIYDAVVQATEEAVINALIVAETMVGVSGRRSPELPNDRVVELLTKQGVIQKEAKP